MSDKNGQIKVNYYSLCALYTKGGGNKEKVTKGIEPSKHKGDSSDDDADTMYMKGDTKVSIGDV